MGSGHGRRLQWFKTQVVRQGVEVKVLIKLHHGGLTRKSFHITGLLRSSAPDSWDFSTGHSIFWRRDFGCHKYGVVPRISRGSLGLTK